MAQARWLRLLVLVGAIAICAPLAHAIEKKLYRCKDFVSDMMAFSADKSITWTEMGTNFSQAVGTIVGVYFGRSGEEYNYESEGYNRFQDAVFGECKRSPNEKVAVVALRTPIRKSSTSAYESMSLVDLRLDFDKLKGRKIEVKGTLQVMGEIAMIGAELFDGNKMFVEVKNLPRASRKYILENCDSGCEVTIRGRASSVMLNPGIIAEEIVTD